MKKTKQIFFGIILITLGVVWAIGALGIADIDIFFDGWWTLFIIVPCGYALLFGDDKLGSLLGICIGVLLLLGCRNIFPFDSVWKLILPLCVVFLGIKILFSAVTKKQPILTVKNGEGMAHTTIFGGDELDYTNRVFSGTALTTVFGGIDCDLRHAIIEQDVVIEATTVFGGIDILLPDNVRVELHSTSVFGGASCEREKNPDGATVTVYINATSIFGGVEVK